jgi:type II secretory pathway component GspD/PulD (secretin)
MNQKNVLLFLSMIGITFIVNAQEPSKSPNQPITQKTGNQSTSVDAGKWDTIPKGTRQVTIVEDRNQTYMISKIYKLKNVTATDIRPWVNGAVRRANPNSNAQRLNYKAAKEQYLVVNMPAWLVDDIDDMIDKIDRPGMLTGTGITQYIYHPRYRSTQDIMDVVGRFTNADAHYYRDPASNLIVGKNSASDAIDIDRFIRIMDRPIPQLEVRLKMYEINMNSLRELGIDYIRWKNGPGADILNIGADLMNFNASNEFFARAMDMVSKGSHAWAGFLVAPNFDASFIRLLAQKGKAKVATSGIITVTNSYRDSGTAFNNADFHISFTPQFQNISKDGNQEITVANNNENTYDFVVRNPIICFQPEDVNHWTGNKSAIMTFGWMLRGGSVVEHDNNGAEVINTNMLRSFLTVKPGTEKLIASFKRKHDVNQNNSMPFFGEIPLIKYLVGSTTASTADYKVFVTVETRPMPPRADLSDWAGKIIDTSRSLLAKQKVDAIKEAEPQIQTSNDDVEEIK